MYYLRDRTGKSARIAEKIKKKIGIDIVETKLEVVKKEKVVEATNDNKDMPKEVKTKIKKESSEEKK